MIQLSSKGQTLFLVGYAFIITEVFAWVLIYHVAPALILDFPLLPATTVGLLFFVALFFGSACVFVIARQTLPSFKFDRAVLLTLIVGLGVNCALYYLLRPFVTPRNFDFNRWELNANYLMYLFVLIGLGPVAEEILNRGCFFEVLRKSWGDWAALRMSTVLFVIPHLIWSPSMFLNPVSILFLILASVLYTYLYMEGGLVPSIVAHMSWNFYVTVLA